ncbi:putative invertase inhibitor [Cucurbita pepo subsp. pepo]|uniref:putative invertase inhibitor n=1 Tax=Cucurbita pepo subsp. pepo TaxID=3664 RepID=UPI000C9D840B|nr:putative invertase inhibitor [Cucurbita pepo subsp. pepo]
MSSLSLSILPLLFFLFSNFAITQSSISNTSSLIYNTCKTSSDQDPNISFNFCLTSLRHGVVAAAKHGRSALDLRRLGLISLRLVRRNVSSTRHHIKKLRRNKHLNTLVKSCLADCLELYSDAIPILKDARRDYKGRRYFETNLKISSVMDDCSTCEDGFEEEGVISPLTNRNHNAFELSAIALSIINMLS